MTPAYTPCLQPVTAAHTAGVIDLLAAEGSDTYLDVLTKNTGFYESLGARPRTGFRLTAERFAPASAPDALPATLSGRGLQLQPEGDAR
jgi:hypothetical protein